MKKVVLFLVMVVAVTAVKAGLVAEVDSNANVMRIEVLPTTDLAKVPVRISMANVLPITCVQCFITTPDSTDIFFYLDDEGAVKDSTKIRHHRSVAYTPSNRWAHTHQPMLSWNTASCRNTMMVLIASPKNDNFAGNDGPLITVYMNVTTLPDGEYIIKMVGANMAWTDNRDIKAFYSPDSEVKFVLKEGKMAIDN